MESLKILLINLTLNWYHPGCEITSKTILDQLTKRGANIEIMNIQDTYKVSDVPTTAFEFTKYKNFTKFLEKNPELIKSLKENNALVINGEGTIHDSRPAPLALLYTAYVAKKIMNKHVSIINHSAYPSDDPSYGNKQENL